MCIPTRHFLVPSIPILIYLMVEEKSYIFRQKHPTQTCFTFFSVLVRFINTFVLFQTIAEKFGRQLYQVQLELLFVCNCVFLELEDKFVQVQLELLFVFSCVFLELEDKFVEVQLELLFVSSWTWKTNFSKWNWNFFL
jgi:hypothetical protein